MSKRFRIKGRVQLGPRYKQILKRKVINNSTDDAIKSSQNTRSLICHFCPSNCFMDTGNKFNGGHKLQCTPTQTYEQTEKIMLCSNPRESRIKCGKTVREPQDPPPLSNRVHQQSHEMWPKKLRGFAATRSASSAGLPRWAECSRTIRRIRAKWSGGETDWVTRVEGEKEGQKRAASGTWSE